MSKRLGRLCFLVILVGNSFLNAQRIDWDWSYDLNLPDIVVSEPSIVIEDLERIDGLRSVSFVIEFFHPSVGLVASDMHFEHSSDVSGGSVFVRNSGTGFSIAESNLFTLTVKESIAFTLSEGESVALDFFSLGGTEKAWWDIQLSDVDTGEVYPFANTNTFGSAGLTLYEWSNLSPSVNLLLDLEMQVSPQGNLFTYDYTIAIPVIPEANYLNLGIGLISLMFVAARRRRVGVG